MCQEYWSETLLFVLHEIYIRSMLSLLQVKERRKNRKKKSFECMWSLFVSNGGLGFREGWRREREKEERNEKNKKENKEMQTKVVASGTCVLS